MDFMRDKGQIGLTYRVFVETDTPTIFEEGLSALEAAQLATPSKETADFIADAKRTGSYDSDQIVIALDSNKTGCIDLADNFTLSPEVFREVDSFLAKHMPDLAKSYATEAFRNEFLAQVDGSDEEYAMLQSEAHLTEEELDNPFYQKLIDLCRTIPETGSFIDMFSLNDMTAAKLATVTSVSGVNVPSSEDPHTVLKLKLFDGSTRTERLSNHINYSDVTRWLERNSQESFEIFSRSIAKTWDIAPGQYTCDYLSSDELVSGMATINFKYSKLPDHETVIANMYFHPKNEHKFPAYTDTSPLSGEYEIILNIHHTNDNEDIYSHVKIYNYAGIEIKDKKIIMQLLEVFSGNQYSEGLEGPLQIFSNDTWENALGTENGAQVSAAITKIKTGLDYILNPTPSAWGSD